VQKHGQLPQGKAWRDALNLGQGGKEKICGMVGVVHVLCPLDMNPKSVRERRDFVALTHRFIDQALR